jgi:NAD(P)-dependent dehydrogenase (short-subunit alcohol dehydrogenase family)
MNYYITGCDSGFGRQLTGMLVQAGHRVFSGVFMQQSVKELVAEHGERCVPIVVDVTDEESVERAAAKIAEHLGGQGLDGVVNNAGILVTPGPVEWSPAAAYKKMFEVNVLGMAMVTKSVLSLIRKAQGRIVNVASIAGRMGLPGQPAYCASKFAVEGYSDVLRKDMYQWGVTVHIIEPGVFAQTGLYSTWVDGFTKNWEALPDKVKDEYGTHYFESSRDALTSSLASGNKLGNTDPSVVPVAMVHALTAANPKYRYRVGNDSKYIITLLSGLHESIQDMLLSAKAASGKVDAATAPSDGYAIAKARYEKSYAFTYTALGAAAAIGLSVMRSRL